MMTSRMACIIVVACSIIEIVRCLRYVLFFPDNDNTVLIRVGTAIIILISYTYRFLLGPSLAKSEYAERWL